MKVIKDYLFIKERNEMRTFQRVIQMTNQITSDFYLRFM